jgi:hypothetical protein
MHNTFINRDTIAFTFYLFDFIKWQIATFATKEESRIF